MGRAAIWVDACPPLRGRAEAIEALGKYVGVAFAISCDARRFDEAERICQSTLLINDGPREGDGAE